MGQDAVPAACLASRTREAGGHRPSPLRGVATSVAATAQVNGGKPVGINVCGNLLRQEVRDVPVCDRSGPPAQNPAVARREALRGSGLLAIQQAGAASSPLFRALRRAISPHLEGRSAHTSDASGAARLRAHVALTSRSSPPIPETQLSAFVRARQPDWQTASLQA